MTIESLISNEELLKLPLGEWEKLFIKQDGKCFPHILIKILEAKIKYLDKLTNSFNYKGRDYWFDKERRNSLRTIINLSSDKIKLILKDEIVEFDKNKLSEFMDLLEIYASLCHINTAQHLIAIKLLKTVGDIVSYDYTSGYPNKIILEE